MRGHLSVLIAQTELLLDEAFGKLTSDQEAAIQEIERRAETLGGMVEPEPPAAIGDRTELTVSVAIITKSEFFDPLIERLTAVYQHDLVVADQSQEVVDILQEKNIDRLIIDAEVDGSFGLRLAEDILLAQDFPRLDIGLLSVYESPSGGPRLGFAGAISRSSTAENTSAIREIFDLPDRPVIGVVGAVDAVATQFDPTAMIKQWSSSADPDMVLVAESELETIDGHVMDELRGQEHSKARPVFIVADSGSRLDIHGWASTIGADRHLVRPPTETSLITELREGFEDPPHWLLSGGP